MQIKLTSGATTQVLCDGISYRGSTGYMIGPIAQSGLELLFGVQVARPFRAAAAIPMSRGNAEGHFSFSVYQIFASIAAAQAWAYYTWPSTALRSGTLALWVDDTHHANLLNAVVNRMACVPEGVNVEVSYSFQFGAISYT